MNVTPAIFGTVGFYAGAFLLAACAWVGWQVARVAFLSAYRWWRGEEQRSC